MRGSIPIIVALAVVLGGCVSGPEWQRPGYDEALNAQDYANCRRDADNAALRVAPALRTFDGDLFDDFGSARPRSRYDLRAEDADDRLRRTHEEQRARLVRDRTFRECLMAHGFTLNANP